MVMKMHCVLQWKYGKDVAVLPEEERNSVRTSHLT
jgi:hypothetical protein